MTARRRPAVRCIHFRWTVYQQPSGLCAMNSSSIISLCRCTLRRFLCLLISKKARRCDLLVNGCRQRSTSRNMSGKGFGETEYPRILRVQLLEIYAIRRVMPGKNIKRCIDISVSQVFLIGHDWFFGVGFIIRIFGVFTNLAVIHRSAESFY